jgi:hypothetical protein
MQDMTTGDKIHVSTDGDATPYIMAPLTQLGSIEAVLQEHEIDYWVDDNAISLNDEPYIAVVNLSRNVAVDRVQALLDSID